MKRHTFGICGYALAASTQIDTHASSILFPLSNDIHSLQRSQILPDPYPAFGRLTTSEKYIVALASCALKTTIDRAATGICIGNVYGSISSDRDYWKTVTSGFPSPALFPSTLPSSPAAETAIALKCKGPLRVFCGPSAGFHAFLSSLALLSQVNETILLIEYSKDPDSAEFGWGSALCLSNKANFAGDFLQIDSETEVDSLAPGASDDKLYLYTLVHALKNHTLFQKRSRVGLKTITVSLQYKEFEHGTAH